MTNLDSILKSRDTALPTKVHLVKAMVFPVVKHGCESWTIKKAWVPKYWCFLNCGVGEDSWEPLDCKEIQPVHLSFFFFPQPVHPKGNQSWIFIWRTDAETETPILWPPDAKNWLAGKDWRREEKGTTEDEMVGSHHPLSEREFE